ncbi:hypothetical protein [Allosphingosinicella deserti]|uniref:Uncharacterized protein n=1 Tax=Allosphingosinicella deserti TaxID=2116704 RepID=A0A2P7QFT8_9SPHN|nr:hypothetical protein [Sphingomonas deserti]PSJ36814.1 hypothetical protein C7I55_24175 [Sphingomonas deserti]
MSPLEQVRSYLQGETPLKVFYDAVSRDKDLQAYLEQEVPLPRYIEEDTLFLYVIKQEPGSVAADLNIKDALARFLVELGVEAGVDQSSMRSYESILDATPSWLVLPDHYATGLINQLPQDCSRAARIKLAKEQIARDFRYLKRPPKWLQTAMWPCENGRPLMFVGQMDVGDLMHDDAQLYVFFDPEVKAFHTLLQVC